ncbi:tRNA (5-methylaminomethyl-2-thiouridine)(34)-methyltransferase MnmD [Alistipes indistinctus]|uniref:tRNA (5-methylaminomethyl-2-thiouridine)(34)-methyltransferase MnmD n=1 Tax=Alistipes indistinctus TaxID=626932 RepID=UPI0015FCD216|nr:tRNA (5-methylaminomethyl-2-thiouridine)(34)-methyltransferase MnmD [Alistipes indistinctus]
MNFSEDPINPFIEPDGLIEPEIEPTDDGSQTLRHPLFGETYHSVRGAEGEARHVYIDAGFHYILEANDRFRAKAGNGADRKTAPVATLRIFEMGFGSGLNAWLTARAAAGTGRRVEYVALEHYPVAMGTVQGLGYAADPLFEALHQAPWNEAVPATESFSLKKVAASLLNYRFDTTFDLVYFDAFAPDAQPELWTREVFAKLFAALHPEGVLVTYSAKGMVKENLRAAGFEVHRLPGALGKHHMLRAVKR